MDQVEIDQYNQQQMNRLHNVNNVQQQFVTPQKYQKQDTGQFNEDSMANIKKDTKGSKGGRKRDVKFDEKEI